MNDRECSRKGGHSSWRLLCVVLAVLASGAWAQESPDAPKPSSEAVPAAPPAAKAETPTPSAPINLYLGSAKDLLPQSRWDTILAAQPADEDEGDLPSLGHQEDVQVEGSRAAPKVPSGIAGLFWALRHPTQAWRAFAPAH
jgi:hypothetical protein